MIGDLDSAVVDRMLRYVPTPLPGSVSIIHDSIWPWRPYALRYVTASGDADDRITGSPELNSAEVSVEATWNGNFLLGLFVIGLAVVLAVLSAALSLGRGFAFMSLGLVCLGLVLMSLSRFRAIRPDESSLAGVIVRLRSMRTVGDGDPDARGAHEAEVRRFLWRLATEESTYRRQKRRSKLRDPSGRYSAAALVEPAATADDVAEGESAPRAARARARDWPSDVPPLSEKALYGAIVEGSDKLTIARELARLAANDCTTRSAEHQVSARRWQFVGTTLNVSAVLFAITAGATLLSSATAGSFLAIFAGVCGLLSAVIIGVSGQLAANAQAQTHRAAAGNYSSLGNLYWDLHVMPSDSWEEIRDQLAKLTERRAQLARDSPIVEDYARWKVHKRVDKGDLKIDRAPLVTPSPPPAANDTS